jgi:hypothetical protein
VKTKLLGFMALVPMCLALRVGAANATTFNWTESEESGSGTFTATFVSGDEYLINPNGITGTIDGLSITALISPGGFGDNDNELFYPSTPQLDIFGVTFVAGGIDWDLYFNGSYVLASSSGVCSSRNQCSPDSFSATLAATPLPTAIPLFGTGLVVMGLFGWRRKRKDAVAIAA